MWWLGYVALGFLVIPIIFAWDICCGRPPRCACFFAGHQNPRLSQPFLLRNTGRLPADPTARDAALGKILHGHKHLVRQYGRWSNPRLANTQAQRYVPRRQMAVQEYFSSLRNGTAARNGLYWAMFSGTDDGDEEVEEGYISEKNDTLQRALGQLVGLRAAEAQIGVAWSSNEKKPRALSLWWGPGGHTEQLHYDSYANIHFQLCGQKTWRLFPPYLDLAPVSCLDVGLHGGHNFSTLLLPSEVHSSDFAQEEENGNLRAALADELTITVRPGQAIYVPAGWWHQVSSSTPHGTTYAASVNLFAPATATPCVTRWSWHLLRLKVGGILGRIHESTIREVPTVILPPLR